MKIKKIEQEFTICKIKDISTVNWEDEFCFVGKTDEELSLVCSTAYAPEETIEREDGWRAFRIEGVLDFSLIGILSEITTLLAEHKIGVFAVSTYNTDYILTKAEHYSKALEVLEQNGYEVIMEFPFRDASNTAVITCSHILENNEPILYVSHDEDDGMWQFLCGKEHDTSEARIVSLHLMFMRDNSIAELAEMPCGCSAERHDKDAKWTITKNN